MPVPAAPEPPLNPELAAQLAAQPAGLTGRGAALWVDIASVYVLRPDELRLLSDAAEEAELVDRLSTALVDADLVVRGSQGQPAASPLVTELRQHRACLASLLRQLHLPNEDADDLTPALRSAAARSAARARWDRPRGA